MSRREILMTTTSHEPPSVNLTPEREPRCRYHNRRGEPCASPSVDIDPMSIQLCIKHLGEAIALYREHLAKYNQEIPK